jgi:hypothetical protein
MATVVANEATPLQRARRVGDSHPPHAEHIGEKFMCHMELVGVRTIPGHQQPPREPRFYHVKARTRGALSELDQRYVQISVQ